MVDVTSVPLIMFHAITVGGGYSHVADTSTSFEPELTKYIINCHQRWRIHT